MQNGGFVNKIQVVRLSVAKIHRHVFENPGRMLQDDELSIDKIAKYSGLDIAEVKLLAGLQTV